MKQDQILALSPLFPLFFDFFSQISNKNSHESVQYTFVGVRRNPLALAHCGCSRIRTSWRPTMDNVNTQFRRHSFKCHGLEFLRLEIKIGGAHNHVVRAYVQCRCHQLVQHSRQDTTARTATRTMVVLKHQMHTETRLPMRTLQVTSSSRLLSRIVRCPLPSLRS